MGNQQLSLRKRQADDAGSEPNGFQWVAIVYLCALFVIAPIKLGSSLNVSGIPFFPMNVFDWIFAYWPPSFMPVMAGIALLLVVLANRPRIDVLRTHPHLWLPAGGLFIAALIGLIATTEVEVARGFAWHTLGVFAGVLAVILQISAYPRSRNYVLISVVAGGMMVAAAGWHQVYFGFDDTKRELMKQVAETGATINPAILDRLNQGRAFASFTYPNSFAAHLLLITPLILFLMYAWGSYVEPPRLTQGILVGIAAILMVGAFGLAQSRAAIVAVGLAAILTAGAYGLRYRTWLKQNQLWLLVGVGVLVAGLALAFRIIQGHRTLESLDARLYYWRSAWLMFLKHPFTGAGMGEFFPWHLRLKPPGAEETRIVHNLFLHFLSQAGIVGGAAAGYFLVQPALLWYRSYRRRITLVSPMLWIAIFFGWTAWALHSLADFNVQIPATLLTAAVLPVLGVDLLAKGRPEASVNRNPVWRLVLIAVAGITLCSLARLPGERAYQAYCNELEKGPPLPELARDAKLTAQECPWSPYPWDWLGKAALRSRQYEVAADAFSEAVRRAPHRASYHAHLAEALAALGRFDEARRAIDQAVLWYPNKPAYQVIREAIENQTIPSTLESSDGDPE